MKVVSISMVRNEADIIETFVRHHAGLVDRMLITNHRSSDATSEILDQLKSEGLPITVFEEHALEQRQQPVMSGLMNRAAREFQSDWVIPLDADEFLVSDGDNDLRTVINRLSANCVAKIPWRTYVPTPKDDAHVDVLKRVRHHRASEDPQYYKVMVPRAIAAVDRYQLDIGSHNVIEVVGLARVPRPADVAPGIALAHIPIRSLQQMQNKVIASWLAWLVNPHRAPTECAHYQTIYAAMKQNVPAAGEQVLWPLAMEWARNYARPADATPECDELVYRPIRSADYALRYTGGKEVVPWVLLLEMAEEFAAEACRLKRELEIDPPGRYSSFMKGWQKRLIKWRRRVQMFERRI